MYIRQFAVAMLAIQFVLFTLAGAVLADDSIASASATIRVIPTSGFNLAITDQLSPSHVIVSVTPPVDNWFGGTLTNLPSDQDCTIGLSMGENAGDGAGAMANLTKWVGLRPVMSYADPTGYASYEWFVKQGDGQWVSGDPLKTGAQRLAGTGIVPEQQVIPPQLAAQFLSADGQYWQPWREVEQALVLPEMNICRMTQRFARPTATVAMRVPYLAAYQQQLFARISARHLPGVAVDNLGTTRDGHPLQVVRITPPSAQVSMVIRHRADDDMSSGLHNSYTLRQHASSTTTAAGAPPVAVIVFAREHGTEQDSSWVVEGILQSLLRQAQAPADTAQPAVYWVIIPILDIDAAESARHFGDTDWGFPYKVTPGMTLTPYLEYLAYLRAFADAGIPVLLTASMHNCECNEFPVLYSPFYQKHVTDEQAWARNYNSWCHAADLSNNRQDSVLLSQLWFNQVASPTSPYGMSDIIGADEDMTCRLGGTCYRLFDTLSLTYEINGRSPDHRLTLQQIQALGDPFVHAVYAYLRTEQGRKRVTEETHFLALRRQQMAKYWPKQGHPSGDPTPGDMLEKGL